MALLGKGKIEEANYVLKEGIEFTNKKMLSDRLQLLERDLRKLRKYERVKPLFDWYKY